MNNVGSTALLELVINNCRRLCVFKPVFHLATLFARREAKTRIRHRDWLKLAGEKFRREQVGTVPTFLSVRAFLSIIAFSNVAFFSECPDCGKRYVVFIL